MSSTAVVRGLIDAGALVATELPEFAPFEAPDPDFAAGHLERRPARGGAMRCASDVAAGEFSASLLDGVTGSGKTEVYFEAVAEALRHGKQVLILLPEIALTVQFLERFAERFGCRPAEWHSDLSQKERTRTYRAVMNGEARVVVGARSSLFLPFASSASSSSMKNMSRPTSRKTASSITRATWRWCARGSRDCPVVLASATPSLETYVNATSGRYAHLRLAGRHGVAVMPQTRLIDLREAKTEPGSWLSQPLREALGRNAWRRRTGDAVPQPPRLCAADLVRELRPQNDVPRLLVLAGRASLSQAAGLSSMRL